MAAPYTVPMNANVPDLATMTKGALNVLDANRKGFFLMVEGGAVDWASHANQPGRIIEEQVDFNEAVTAVCRWVRRNSSWDETLVIVTGDHETGYLWGPGSGADATGKGTWIPLVEQRRGHRPRHAVQQRRPHQLADPDLRQGRRARAQLRAAATRTDPVRGKYLDNTAIAETDLLA